MIGSSWSSWAGSIGASVAIAYQRVSKIGTASGPNGMAMSSTSCPRLASSALASS